MGFSEYLDEHKASTIDKKYNEKYLEYARICKIVNKSTANHVKVIEEEFNRVFDYVNNETERYKEELKKIEKILKDDKSKSKDNNSSLVILQEDMKAFAEFIRINIIGFKKLLKHSDKASGLNLSKEYNTILSNTLTKIEHLNELIYKQSKLKLKTQNISGKSSVNLSFIRKTNKYWVHKDNLIPLKLSIVRHLPLYVFDLTKDKKENINTNNESPYAAWNHKTHDTNINSIYFDNKDHDLYMGRLQKNEGAEAIRIRYYGELKSEEDLVFVERKRHCDSWTGEESKKLRFKLQEKYVDQLLMLLLNNKDTSSIWKEVKKINLKSDHSSEEKEHLRILFNEVTTAIKNQKLFPSVRTYYKRIAFQLPGDATVRISLDSDLVMVDESKEYFKKINDKTFKTSFTNRLWRRTDIKNVEYPFYALHDTEIVRFPHSILEVKTQSLDDTKPEWITEIIESCYTEHVHKFSKFLHGTAILHENIQDIPYWLPQMRTDIRKDPFMSIKSRKEFINGALLDISSQVNEKDSKIEDSCEISRSGYRNNGRYSPNRNNINTTNNTTNNTTRISIPVRVEPKVFFANERTFLSWVQFAIFLGGIGTAMLNITNNYKANICGAVMIAVAIVFACYALHLFFWRANKIRSKDPGPYDDTKGPFLMVGMFIIALIFSVYFKFPMKGNKSLQ